jgi:beta-N-acetylhexosaminidase
MGYDGIVMTDSLGMAGVNRGRGQAQSAVEAVQAGADIVLSTGPLTAQEAIHGALMAAVQNGEIAPQRIDESVLRILRAKHKYRLFEPQHGAHLDGIEWVEHQKMAEKMALAAVTLYKDEAALVPLPEDAQRLLILSPHELPRGRDKQETLLAEGLRAHGYEVTELVFNVGQSDSRDTTQALALQEAPEHDVVLFGEWQLLKRYANSSDQWQESLISALVQTGKPVIMISWHDPAAIIRAPEIATYLVAYGNTVGQVQAVTEVLAGTVPARGSLPLSITLP